MRTAKNSALKRFASSQGVFDTVMTRIAQLGRLTRYEVYPAA
jgi:hypothetical protein